MSQACQCRRSRSRSGRRSHAERRQLFSLPIRAAGLAFCDQIAGSSPHFVMPLLTEAVAAVGVAAERADAMLLREATAAVRISLASIREQQGG